MSRGRVVGVIMVAVGALLGALGVSGASAAPPAGTDASEVTHWNQVAATTLAAVPGPNGGAPPAFQINMGMVQGAVYDAVNAIGPKQHRPYLLHRRTGAKASIDAAIATAAYDALSALVSAAPERVPFPGRAGLLSTLSSAYAASLDSIDNDSFKKQGIAVGHAAADAMLDAREGDGRFGPSAWVPNPAAGHWQPLFTTATPPQPILDPTPWVGNVKPFLIQSSSQFRSAPPPALGSTQWATEFNEVKDLGRINSTIRSDTQTYIAKWWQSAPVLSWNEVARQLIARTGLDAADSARLLALQNLSGADAAINCWNDKYHFDFWRPWNAITTTLDDKNDATETDPTWAALLTAPYPEWTSGHNCLDAAHTTVLRMFFGDDPVGGPFQITSTFVNPGGPAVRTFDTFTQPLAELIEARIWAGLHYRSADVAGQLLGRNVANYGAANYFQPTASAHDRRGPVVTPVAEVGSDEFVIGSTIGPDRALYVTDGVAGSVLRIDRRSGQVTTFADGLPPKAFRDDVGGPIDIAFSGRTAYVLVTLVSGTIFGEPFGDPAAINGLYRIERDGSHTLVADLGQWSVDNPPEPAFFVDTGVQFALESYRGGFLVTDGHHNRVLWVSRHGSIHEVATFGNVVPTGLEAAFGRVFVTQLGPIPHVPEDGKVVALGREPREIASGASMLIDVERGPHSTLYGLSQGQWDGVGEGSRALPNTGRLVVVGRHGELKPVVGRRGNELVLDRPTSLEFVGSTAYVVSASGVVNRIDGL